MSRRNRIRLGHGHERWIFAARYDECLRCPLALSVYRGSPPQSQLSPGRLWNAARVPDRRCPTTGQLLPEGDPKLEPLPVAPPTPVIVLPAPPPQVASGGTCAMFWKDIPSSRLRREWSGRLRSQRVEVEELASNHKPAPVLLDRHRRAHRRLSWAQCHKRNQSPGAQVHWSVQLHGVPSGISAYLKSLEQGLSASAA